MSKSIKITCVIPVRYKSSRFMGKALALINGKSLVSIVYENAVNASQVSEVIVATDDERIYKHCAKQGIEVVYTSEECPSGSERVAEVARTITSAYVFELQGDQPLVTPEIIDDFLLKCQSNLNKYASTDVFIAGAECSEKDTISSDVLKVFMDNKLHTLTCNETTRFLDEGEKKQIETVSMIDEAKAVCKELGYKTGSERFADCSLRILEININAQNSQQQAQMLKSMAESAEKTAKAQKIANLIRASRNLNQMYQDLSRQNVSSGTTSLGTVTCRVYGTGANKRIQCY